MLLLKFVKQKDIFSFVTYICKMINIDIIFTQLYTLQYSKTPL